MSNEWSEWRLFPDPRKFGILVAPFGPGCYELRNGDQLVLYGSSRNVAHRVSSLLPKEWGCGGRKNHSKQEYVLQNLGTIEYRTVACADVDQAREEEKKLSAKEPNYLFPD